MKVNMQENKKEVQTIKAYSGAQLNRQYLILVGCPICGKEHTFFAGQVGEDIHNWEKEVTLPCDPSARYNIEWNGKFYSGMESALLKRQKERTGQKADPPKQKPVKYTPLSGGDNSNTWGTLKQK